MTGWEGRISSCPRCIFHAEHGPHVGAGLPAMTSSQPPHIYLTPRNQTVGAGLPAMTASQPTPIHLTPHHPTVGAGLLAKAAWQSTQLDWVHIHCCGNGYLGFRPDGVLLLNSVYGPDTWLTPVRGHSGHIMRRSQGYSRRRSVKSDGRNRRQTSHRFQR